jgi:hypothetical protein
MQIDLVSYLIAFALTIVLEVITAVLLGFRTRLQIAAVIAVNVFSHPLLHVVFWVIGSIRSAPVGAVGVLLLEGAVVVVEWQLLCFALRRYSRFQLFILSLAMNGVSYLAGLLLPL